MIELWHISIALVAVSLAAWFQVHSKYSKSAREIRKKRLEKVQRKIDEICELRQTRNKEEKIESEIAPLTKLYEESNEPVSLCEQTWSIFSYAGLCFLASVFCRLGTDLLFISQLASIEAFTFLFGTILFIIAFMNTRELMKLLSSEEDPSISTLQAIFIAIFQALHLYVIWLLLPSFLSATLTVYDGVFFALLWLTNIGAGLLLWKRREPKSKEGVLGFFLIYAPWIWLAILAVLTYLGLLR